VGVEVGDGVDALAGLGLAGGSAAAVDADGQAGVGEGALIECRASKVTTVPVRSSGASSGWTCVVSSVFEPTSAWARGHDGAVSDR
jgi:hypothetical protein